MEREEELEQTIKEQEEYTTLDTEQCKWWVNNLFGMAKEQACNSRNFDDAEEMQSAQDKIIKTLEKVEEFEKAQIITGGRLNGRAFAYKCGLEDGKRKALEQQSEDCVSRAEVLKQMKEWKDCEFVKMTNPYHYLEKRIQSMPPVTPTQSWIPVSERLPKESDGAVLITVNGEVNTGRYSEFSNTWYKGDMRGVGGDDPIAWQPLPKPYEEKRGNEEWKYIAVLDSENEFTEEVINDLKNTGFLGDSPRYAFVIDDIQERKVGEWCKQNDDYFDWYECSECGYGSEGEMQYSSKYDVRTKYCPNCGAKMRGAENG